MLISLIINFFFFFLYFYNYYFLLCFMYMYICIIIIIIFFQLTTNKFKIKNNIFNVIGIGLQNHIINIIINLLEGTKENKTLETYYFNLNTSII